jgi:hypothetical protein
MICSVVATERDLMPCLPIALQLNDNDCLAYHSQTWSAAQGQDSTRIHSPIKSASIRLTTTKTILASPNLFCQPEL